MGLFIDAGGGTHGFLLEGGTFSQIDFPGAKETEIRGINDRGRIVGLFRDAGDVAHGLIVDDGVTTQIDFPGATQTVIGDINDGGQLVGGFADDAGLFHGFVIAVERDHLRRVASAHADPAQRTNEHRRMLARRDAPHMGVAVATVASPEP